MIEFKHKIKGFTLSDVLVALAISGIILGIIYVAITLITKNIGSIKDNYLQEDVLQLAEQRITLDFNRFPEILYNKFENKIILKSPLDSITYLFEGDYILRNTDALSLDIAEKTIYKNGKTTERGTMDAIKLTCNKGTETVSIFVFKENDTYTLLNDGN